MKKQAAALVAVLLVGLLSACGSNGSKTSKGSTENQRADSADFGSLKNVCHSAKAPNKANSDRGVTANSINVTTISDAGSTLQRGLDQELWDVAKVFSQWCNDHGGINGRRIIVSQGDAQLTLYRQAIDQACTSSFALVGGGGAMDDLGQTARLQCLLPDIPAFTASSVASTASLIYPTQLTPLNQVTIGGLKTLDKMYPGTFAKAATIYATFPSIKYVIDKDLSAAQAKFGMPGTPIFQDTYPVTGPVNWQHTVDGIKKYKVEGVMVAGQPKDVASLLISIQASGYRGLKWVYSEANLYDQTFIKEAAGALDAIPFYAQVFVQPFETAGSGKAPSAIDDYLALFDKYLPRGRRRRCWVSPPSRHGSCSPRHRAVAVQTSTENAWSASSRRSRALMVED